MATELVALQADLVAKLEAIAQDEELPLNDVVARLIMQHEQHPTPLSEYKNWAQAMAEAAETEQ